MTVTKDVPVLRIMLAISPANLRAAVLGSIGSHTVGWEEDGMGTAVHKILLVSNLSSKVESLSGTISDVAHVPDTGIQAVPTGRSETQ